MKRTLLLLGLATIVLAAACGGKTETGPAESAGGSAGKAGSGGTAGTAGNGGSGGTTPSGGSGGAAGIGGAAGSGGSTWAACKEPINCTLVSTDCCHTECFEASLSEFAALNSVHVQEFLDSKCTPPPPCPGFYCPEPDHQTWVRTAAQFATTCTAGTCTAFDIRTSDLSACTTQNDCVLRWGTGCCPSCSASNNSLVAVSSKAPLYETLCGNVDVDCCPSPPFPANAVAMCGSKGHCEVVWAL
ncbi:MAG: hypothetical protein HY898_11190 [Deltaproteobacteria bacterium]|nr:hypothetical protein [Deltaproteobacteria bacterium]